MSSVVKSNEQLHFIWKKKYIIVFNINKIVNTITTGFMPNYEVMSRSYFRDSLHFVVLY